MNRDHRDDCGGKSAFALRRFDRSAATNLLALALRRPDLRGLTQELASRWNGGLPSDVSELGDWVRTRRDTLPLALVACVRDIFLSAVDEEIQSVFSRHLAARAVAAHRHPDDVLPVLAGAASDVARVLARYDFDWMARWLGADQSAGVKTYLDRLANFAFPVEQVNLRFTYHCNASCGHCYNESGPSRKADRLDPETMFRIISEMPAAGIPALHLSGGEPLLYLDLVCSLIAAARSLGIERVSLNTNGFWASSPRSAVETLERLARAGMFQGPQDFIKVSTGAFHTEFISIQHLEFLAPAYREVGRRPLRVDVADGSGVSSVDAIRNLVERVGADSIVVQWRNVLPIGRGGGAVGRHSREIGACRAVDQLAVDPDGRVRPCCGLNAKNEGIVLGDSRLVPLKDLVKRMQNDPVLHRISTQPMTALWAALGMQPQPVAGACEVCQLTVGAAQDRRALQDHLATPHRWYPFWFKQASDGELQVDDGIV